MEKKGMLEFVSKIVIPATAIEFVAKDKFAINTGAYARKEIDSNIKINYSSLLQCSGFGDKIEKPIAEQTLYCYKLRQSLHDSSIAAKFGGVELAETTLSMMFLLMEKQKDGENGILLNNGKGNIFYIKNQNGVFWVICIGWIEDGWYINGRPFEYFPLAWPKDYQIFSCIAHKR